MIRNLTTIARTLGENVTTREMELALINANGESIWKATGTLNTQEKHESPEEVAQLIVASLIQEAKNKP